MATEKEASLQSCASDPNFAVICSFLDQFAIQCGITHPTFRELQDMLEDTQEVSQVLIDIHIKLLRKARKSFTADKWEKALAKFCHTYSQQDGWELERFGYKKSRLGVKVKLLKVLLETQFDVNGKFKTEVNKVSAKNLRIEPLGRDQNGLQYWCQFDKSSHVRIYREDVDDETWELVASDRNGLVQLIDSLSNGEGQLELNAILNEDSTSQEVEKPITDTGQEVDEVDELDEEADDEEEIEEEEEGVEEEEDVGEEEQLEGESQEAEDEELEPATEQKVDNIKLKIIEEVNVPKIVNEDKTSTVTNIMDKPVIEHSDVIHPIETNASSLTGVDLSIRSESKKFVVIPQTDYLSSIPERPYLPERNDILSQMSARFNEVREAEDLSVNPMKKVKLDDDQPMMLVKKDIVVSKSIEEPVSYVTETSSGQDYKQGNLHQEPKFSEVIEEPIQYVVGSGSGAECDIANPKFCASLADESTEYNQENILEEPEFSEVIEEPVQYIFELGSGAECDIGNPRLYESLEPESAECKKKNIQEEPEFSEVVEEPVQYVIGLGSGKECDIGNPILFNKPEGSSSYTVSTMGIECSLRSMNLSTHEPNFSDVIEEPVMFVRGFGYGHDCLTGNPDEIDESIEDKSPEKKPKLWSIDAICSSEKLLPESLKQDSSGSSQKEPEGYEGTSMKSEDNGPEKLPSVNSFDEENDTDVCKSSDANLKPSSDVKPILENFPMKDKPPDGNVSDNDLVPEVSKEINSHDSNNEKNVGLRDSILNCVPSPNSTKIDEELEANQVSNTESALSSTEFDADDKTNSPDQTKSSEGAQTSDDISSDICTSDDKLTIDDQPSSTDPSVIDKSSIMPTTSEDNSRNSIISSEFLGCKSSMAMRLDDGENSNMSIDCQESRSSSNLLSTEEREKSDCSDIDMESPARRKPRKSFEAFSKSELDIESRSSINSDKSNSKVSKSSTSSKNSNTSSSSNKSKSIDEGINCGTNKFQNESIYIENSKIGSDKQIDTATVNKLNLPSIENGSNLLTVGDCSVVCEKLSDGAPTNENFINTKTTKRSSKKDKSISSSENIQKDPGTVSVNVKNKSDESDNISGNNPVSSDKIDEKRKNVMLTNIIEVCLDNDTNSRDNSKSGLKGQLNAKFNDLFSAKNLLEPSIRDNSEENLNENSTTKVTEHCTVNSVEENLETDEECKKNSNEIEKEDNSNIIEMEKNSSLENVTNVVTNSLEVENDIKQENGESVELEETEPKEEKSVKNIVRGRKSRTNSLNNDDETEIPNKIRKTDTVQKIQARRISRRNTRSASQAEGLEAEVVEKLDKLKGNKTKIKKEIKKEKQNSEDELNIKEKKTEIKINDIDENDKMVKVNDDKLEDNNEDDIDESIKKEVDAIGAKLNLEDIVKKEDENSMSDGKESKGFSLSSFSLEQPVEEVPVLEILPEPKAQQSRKRRNSRKLSRSEEDGGEVEEEGDEEEAGGKKPRLRGKTRRSKGTPPASRPQPPDESSSDDDQAENSEATPVKGKRKPLRPRGRPLKRKGVRKAAIQKSKEGSQKDSENSETVELKKESKTDEESDSEKEDKKQTSNKKETRKKQLPNRRDSEKEEKKSSSKKLSKKEEKQATVKKETKALKKGKVKSRAPPPKKENKKKSVKDEIEEESDNEAEVKEEEEDEEEEEENVSEQVKDSKSDEEEEDKSEEEEEEKPRPKKKGRPKKKKTLLGLMESDLIHSKPLQSEDSEGSRVRQSRRIAQIKIKEEAERRAIEEATMMCLSDIKKKSKEDKLTPKKHKKKKGKIEKLSEEEDETFKEPADEKKRGRKKKKKRGMKYDINKPWQSSSDSSSEEAEEEEEHYEEEDDEEDIRARKVISDHEFSPESDLEKEEEEQSAEPVRRARTAKKADEDVEKDEEAEMTEDYPCKKCGEPDHPEWILLCDRCDSGYHASCLRPTLMLIPEGDWFCPPCQHAELVSKLKETLRAFERNTKRRENEELRKKRLAYVGISLANVLPMQEKNVSTGGRRVVRSESSESSSEISESSEEEPVYQLRQRRAALQANYRFNDYDDLINSAIQDEMEAVKGAGNMGRGKDIANIVEAEKKASMNEDGVIIDEEAAEAKAAEEEEQGENWRPPVVPKVTSLPSLRKKPKKLTDLDKQSDDDDADSDEDFKGSSEEEEYSSSDVGDSDDSVVRRQPVRRSSRTRVSRIDKEFINDDSESSDEPRRKKTRRVWASSSSESSDSTWGRRKRKSKTYSRIKTSKSGKKKKKKFFDSDSDKPKKIKPKRPKIRYGLSEDDEEPIRRTRGKKMSYLEVAGSDTEEEVIARSRKLISEDEEEFVPEKEEVEGDEDENEPEEVEPEEEEEEQTTQKVDTANVPQETEKNVTEEIDRSYEAEVPEPEIENNEDLDDQRLADEDDEDDDQVEEEEIEEEVEEEVEEEEEEEYEDGSIEEAKNLVREKVEEPKSIIQSPIKLSSGVSITKVPIPPQAAKHTPPTLPVPATTAIPTPVIKEEKKDEKEEKKEPTPAIRLVPSAKLLDPNKRRPPEESVIRGMLAGGGYYRPQLMQAAGRQPFRQRYPDQQRYLFQQAPAPHQFYPGGAYFSSEEYGVGGGYEEQIDPNIPGGDEEGVFSGLVSYFSSQREDNLDS